MNKRKDLKQAMAQISKRVAREGRPMTEEMINVNASIYELFAAKDDVLTTNMNVTRRGLARIERYARMKKFDWKGASWEDLKTWLYDNWDKILRVMVSLCLMFLL